MSSLNRYDKDSLKRMMVASMEKMKGEFICENRRILKLEITLWPQGNGREMSFRFIPDPINIPSPFIPLPRQSDKIWGDALDYWFSKNIRPILKLSGFKQIESQEFVQKNTYRYNFSRMVNLPAAKMKKKMKTMLDMVSKKMKREGYRVATVNIRRMDIAHLFLDIAPGKDYGNWGPPRTDDHPQNGVIIRKNVHGQYGSKADLVDCFQKFVRPYVMKSGWKIFETTLINVDEEDNVLWVTIFPANP